MSTVQQGSTSRYESSGGARGDDVSVNGWWMFAGFMLGIAGTLDVIWGIAAISGSKFFVAGERYIISDLHTWGCVTLILGCVELIASLSLFAGGSFGRWMGIITASLVAIVSLLTIPAYPFWSLCVFTLSILTVFGLLKPAVREA
jgi:hypothetical protein